MLDILYYHKLDTFPKLFLTEVFLPHISYLSNNASSG